MTKMTNEEAIKHIRRTKCSGDTDCSECCYDPNWCVYAVAIKAMRKQIPQKPIIKKGTLKGYYKPTITGSFCPLCDELLDGSRAYRSSHCDCGQALDWGAEE